MNDNVLLIGASGFVGTRLLETAIADFNIKNLDKQQSHFYPEITQIGDVRDQQALDQALAGFDTVVLLAAEHRDDVSPTSLYYDVNVQGTRNVLAAMEKNGVKNIIFTSSVAVYGLNKHNPDENHPHDPFNHYGKSKWQAEEVLREWYNKAPTERSLTIIRPTVIFGERNRGNVYNLLKQIAGGKFDHDKISLWKVTLRGRRNAVSSGIFFSVKWFCCFFRSFVRFLHRRVYNLRTNLSRLIHQKT